MKYWCSWRGSLLNIILQLQRSHIKIQLHFPSCNPVFNTCFHQERKSILFCWAFLRLCSVCSKNKVGLQMSSRNSGVYFPRGDENSEYVQPWKGLGTLNIPKKKRLTAAPAASAHDLGSFPAKLLCWVFTHPALYPTQPGQNHSAEC